MVLTVVVPAYNEAGTVEQAIQQLRNLPLTLEVIAVNDGSSDDTGAILDVLQRQGLVQRVIHQPTNRGKGAAIRAAVTAATGHVIVVQDADLEYDPQELPRLIDPIRLGKADAVYGSRTARLAQARARIWEMPITYSGRTYAEGKKIGWRDGVAALWHILRFNLLQRKPSERR
ncbi:MAG: glycosyltransferase family 2 protein [Gemmatimonadetes bacterium]|nr:glycosyltransferase family 2 protein [Gemmatimonadota bacterium]